MIKGKFSLIALRFCSNKSTYKLKNLSKLLKNSTFDYINVMKIVEVNYG